LGQDFDLEQPRAFPAKRMIAAASNIGEDILIIAIFIAVGITVIVTRINQGRARQTREFDLLGLSVRLKFANFNPARDDEFALGWGFLTPLAQGHDRYAFNILRGTYQEQSLFVFDYYYRIGSGKSEQEHQLTLLMLVCKEAFPRVSIGPENMRTKFAALLGFNEDIQFESAKFSRQFCVHSADKKFAYDVCNPQMIEYLLANPGLQIEIQGPAIMLVFEPPLSAGSIEFNLPRLAQIRALLPEYLFTQTA
jgi:hypothetical protein